MANVSPVELPTWLELPVGLELPGVSSGSLGEVIVAVMAHSSIVSEGVVIRQTCTQKLEAACRSSINLAYSGKSGVIFALFGSRLRRKISHKVSNWLTGNIDCWLANNASSQQDVVVLLAEGKDR